jgi:cbb3-type cytochrome c oxidase subunit III
MRVRIGAVVVLIVLAVVVGQTVHTRSMYGRLLRTEADKTEADPALSRFAATEAKAVFAKTCASCHGPEMKGDPKKGVPDLTDADWLYGSGRAGELEQTILYGIRSGHPRAWNLAEMPGFGQAVPSTRYKTPPLTPGQIKDVIEYLRQLEDKDFDAAAAARGVTVYSDTGQCFDCHATDGAGDQAIGAPNLLDDIWLYGDGSRESVFRSVADGHHGVCPSWSGRLPAGQIRALAVYIHAHASKTPAVGRVAAPSPSEEKPS